MKSCISYLLNKTSQNLFYCKYYFISVHTFIDCVEGEIILHTVDYNELEYSSFNIYLLFNINLKILLNLCSHVYYAG